MHTDLRELLNNRVSHCLRVWTLSVHTDLCELLDNRVSHCLRVRTLSVHRVTNVQGCVKQFWLEEGS